jgi:hypothetical protein
MSGMYDNDEAKEKAEQAAMLEKLVERKKRKRSVGDVWETFV